VKTRKRSSRNPVFCDIGIGFINNYCSWNPQRTADVVSVDPAAASQVSPDASKAGTGAR
jgi:hypothetical protein